MPCFPGLLWLLAASLLCVCPSFAQTPDKHFDGVHLGANAGMQNLFGGSFVGGIDVLAQESRFVAELFTGFRKEFLNGRMVAGAELQAGFTNGSLMHRDDSRSLHIRYENNFQSGYGLTLGTVLMQRKTLLVYAYAFETERKFDVTIRDAFSTYQQKDEQGMLKYGLGLEARIWRKFHARATLGRLRVDFGDRITNIKVDDKWDFTIGVVYQFHFRTRP